MPFLPIAAALAVAAPADDPFAAHGRLQVAKSGTHLAHADGTPFFFLADTCWTGPALSSQADWDHYLADRKRKGFTAIQFNMASPWRAAPTDAEGRQSYAVADGRLRINEAFYRDRLDARFRAVNKAGLLAVPVLCWAHRRGDAGKELSESQLVELIRFEVDRYKGGHVLWVLAGDNDYTADAGKWKRVGRAVFGDDRSNPVTTHPTGENWPWDGWDDEAWLTVLGYQSGHGDSPASVRWLTHGPVARYGRRKSFTRPVVNLEAPYEAHNGYKSRTPLSAAFVRAAVYRSLLVAPPAGVTYGGHGVWSWHTTPGGEPTGHPGTGPAELWKDALDLPAAAQMGYVRKLFESLPWADLRPAPDASPQAPGGDPAKWVATAATPDGKVSVTYVPAGGTAAPTDGGSGSRTWFNPRTGEPAAGGGAVPPDAGDWVLVVRK